MLLPNAVICNCSISVEDNYIIHLEIQQKLILQLFYALHLMLCTYLLFKLVTADGGLRLERQPELMSSIKPETGISNFDIATSH